MTRILIVEDSPTQAQQLVAILECEDFEAQAVADAAACLERLAQARFDLVLSDLFLPVTSGFELCRQIKANPKYASLPVVLLTKWADPINVLRGLESGADGFITKGREPEEIVRRLRDILAHPVRPATAADAPAPVTYMKQPFRISAPRERLLEVLLLAFEDQVQLDRHRQDELALRRQAEDALRQLNEQLEKRVLERTSELAQANRHLSQKNQENELFVYSVSHDLRSPLVNLEGFASELGRTCQELHALLAAPEVPASVRARALHLLDEDAAESIQFIQTAVKRLSNIINALLSLSRAGRVEHRMQTVHVQGIVGTIVTSMAAMVAEKKAKIIVKDLAPVWSDPRPVEQIFANLIGNALNYLDPTRPGVIEIGTVPSQESVGTDGSRKMHTFSVKDNGLGIPEAHRAMVFRPFQRVHPGVAKGEGIGLTLVHRIVDRLGGKIWFESVPGEGTSFFVTLPVSKAQADGP